MAQQTFSGVPGAFSAGEVLSSADQNLIRDLMVAVIKEGMTGDTGEILPMIMDLTNNRIVLDTGGLEFSNGSLQTIAGMTAAGGTFTGAVEFGSDGSGVDCSWHSLTSSDLMFWDASEESLTITGTDGQTALAVADGNVTITDTLTVSGGLVAPLQINAQTGTTYTFVLADAGKLVTSSNGSAQTITVPPNSGVAFAIGTQIIVQNIGSANATLATAGTPTLNSKDSNLEIDGQFAAATLIKTATDAWSIIGALA